MKTLIVAAQMQPASRLKDDSVTLKFVTAQEVSTELFTEIDAYRRVNGFLAFQPDQFKGGELPKHNAVEGEQTPSQQLRGALWVLHQKHGLNVEWPVFYERQMERIRQTVIASIE